MPRTYPEKRTAQFPDKYVANSGFTQDFNRYSYCRNNPLSYTDPSGNNIFDMFFNIISFPAKLLTVGFTWINDKMNGDSRPNGYFNASYLCGVTEPGGYFNYNPVNAVPFGHPLYTQPFAYANTGSVAYGTGWAMGADNEWGDITSGFGRNLKAPLIKTKTMAEKIYSTENFYRLGHGEPVPQNFNNAGFVEKMKNRWFRKAPNPIGYRIHAFSGGEGYTQAHTSDGHLTGESTVHLHEDLAFTSLQQLFLTLGHELLHVSQIKELAGFKLTIYNDPPFLNMMDHYAYEFSYFLLNGSKRTPFVNDYSEYHARLMHTNFSWSNKKSWTFW